jgi:mono/diheme cytochrome c family protein
MSQTSGLGANTVKVFQCIGSRCYLDRASTRFDSRLSALAVAVCFLFLFLSLTTVSAQVPPSEATLTANPVFQKNCAKCHGKTAEGRHFGGPSLSSAKAATASTEDLRNTISNGKDHMPKYSAKLTPEQIDTLVHQIKSLNKKE